MLTLITYWGDVQKCNQPSEFDLGMSAMPRIHTFCADKEPTSVPAKIKKMQNMAMTMYEYVMVCRLF